MFTGLIEEIGTVKKISTFSQNLLIEIEAKKVLGNAKVGDSIAVIGVCLTATKLNNNSFVADVMSETYRRTRLKELKVGSKVNLEKSVTVETALGGHIVYGDVDFTSKIESIKKEGIATIYRFSVKPNWMRYIANKGRVSIDGASLTVMNRDEDGFSVSLIPHSSTNLILSNMVVGENVNIETDIIAKYCETLFNQTKNEKESGLTVTKLAENGFL